MTRRTYVQVVDKISDNHFDSLIVYLGDQKPFDHRALFV